jgi:hypothetical protein
MARSPLFGRRVHIAGSVVGSTDVAATAEVEAARELVAGLVTALMRRGANFVVPVDAEPVRAMDGMPVCFDWLVWQTIRDALALRPPEAPVPLAVAVQHRKNEEQVPAEMAGLWDGLRYTSLVRIENTARWDMAAKRMDTQARYGDILVTLGGSEGVQYLANLYHDAGKPVVPLNIALGPLDVGSRRIYDFGMSGGNAGRLFQIADGDPHDWLNRIGFPTRQPVVERVEVLVSLLEALERPMVFAVRLLNEDHADFPAVQDFFDVVVKPVVEDELGYRLCVVDGRHPQEHARVDEEIFTRLHRSSAVIADITAARPNCFLELGYALGRALPTVVTARAGSETPFDIATFSGLRWKQNGTVEERRRAFRQHWQATRTRRPLVKTEGLIP